MKLTRLIKHLLGRPVLVRSILYRSESDSCSDVLSVDSSIPDIRDEFVRAAAGGQVGISIAMERSFNRFVAVYPFDTSMHLISKRISEVSESMDGAFDRASICVVVIGSDSTDSRIACAQLKSCIHGWAVQLAEMGVVCNGVFVHSGFVASSDICNAALFLTSRHGQVMNGEIIELTDND